VEARGRVPRGEIPGGAKAMRGSAAADRETGDADRYGSPGGSLPWSRDCQRASRLRPASEETGKRHEGAGRRETDRLTGGENL